VLPSTHEIRAEGVRSFAEHHRNINNDNSFPLVPGKYGQETTTHMPCPLRRNLACPPHWNYQLSADCMT